MGHLRVALVNMPFGTIFRPSIGLSLLKAALERDGHQADLFYLNLDFAEMIGHLLYTRISDSAPTALLGEWLFSDALVGPDQASEESYLNDVLHRRYLKRGVTGELIAEALDARTQVEPYLDHCLNAVDWDQYDLIGFTSVFQQNVASLALARRIKERFPAKVIAVGGANTEGVMGQAMLRAFPFIDLVCSGEGDIAFPEFVRRMAAGEPLSGVPGITRTGDLTGLGTVSGAPVHDMDGLPYPNYDDYFEQLQRFELQGVGQEVRFLFESSRGCWWGAKSHCKFCGLNGNTLAFRSKSAPRALAELQYLFDRYSRYTRWAAAVDNIIDMQYFRDFLPALKELGLELNMFYETKANLTREQVELFADAGFHAVQPGIESLSTSILKLMRKGVTALQNIQVLKFCREYGVKPYWNYLSGFPGEDEAEYERVRELIPSLTHLDAPYGVGQLRLDRFSPYFDNPEEHGVSNVRPLDAYRHVYRGLPGDLLFHLAYYFDFDYADGRNVHAYTRALEQEVMAWRKLEGSELFSVNFPDCLVIFDLRPAARQVTCVLSGAERLLYIHCDVIRTRNGALRYLAEAGCPLNEEHFHATVERLLHHRLMVAEGNAILSLAIPLGRYSPGPAGAERFLQFLADQRKLTGQETAEGVRLAPGPPDSELIPALKGANRSHDRAESE